MMKFFRKYNKHLLAVFMALLLIIWLGDTALEDMVKPKPGKQVIGTAVTGPVTEYDRSRAQSDTELQRLVRLSWQDSFRDPQAPPDEQLDFIDWILLQREAQRYGIEVKPEQAKSMLAARGLREATVRQAAAFRDVATKHVYEAAARYFAVQEMLAMLYGALLVPEPQLRLLARNAYERASIELVTFPAEAFADPNEMFTEEELQEHFDKHEDKRTTGKGLDFGYFIEPRIKMQYIKIDPSRIKDHLRGSESSFAKRAFGYWKENQTKDPRFQRSAEEMKAARAAANATTNGESATTNGAPATTKPALEVAPFYETFAEAREKAVDAVRTAEAEAEAERLANKLALMLKEPWFDIRVEPTAYKPAPDLVKNEGYYETVVAQLPANLQYVEGIEIGSLDWISQADLAEVEGLGAAAWQLPDERTLPLWQLAFNAEKLVTIPEDAGVDHQLYLSLWQTLVRPLPSPDGALYLFRVTDAAEGRAPQKLDEVIEQVVEDLRLLRGMDRARAAAEEFAANVGTNGLKAAWDQNTALTERITPDRGGYFEPAAFPRDASSLIGIANFVPGVGSVTDEFIEKAFELAAAGEKSGCAVVELPDLAKVAIIKGKELFPLYDEVFKLRRLSLQQLLTQQKARDVMFNWLNAKHVRERNQWRVGSDS